MAYAKITRQWPDDSACVIEVGCLELCDLSDTLAPESEQ